MFECMDTWQSSCVLIIHLAININCKQPRFGYDHINLTVFNLKRYKSNISEGHVYGPMHCKRTRLNTVLH